MKSLTKQIKQIHKEAVVKQDGGDTARIFIYKKNRKQPVTTLIDRSKNWEIVKISDYPEQKGFPLSVIRIKRLHKIPNQSYRQRSRNKV